MAQSVHKKEVKQALKSDHWGPWEDITLEAIMRLADKPERNRLLNYEKNNIYSIQIIQSEAGKLLGIRRHDQSTDIPWSHKQRIKNEIFGCESQAIEIFPPQDVLIDGANMFWLWILDTPVSGCSLKDALKGLYS